ncbi:kinesin-like protein KIF11-B isoform X1 [Argonauta hians]
MAPKKNGNQNIKVAVRCRPLIALEKKAGSYAVVNMHPDKKEVSVREKMGIVSQMKTFGFDYVFAPEAKQIDIYKAVVVPIVDEVLQGYNCTIFAYGQTGTGKTYTMEGGRSHDAACSWENDPEVGVIPRSMSHIFHELKKQDVEFSIRVSFIELYNEELFDLLGSNASNLRMFEDPKRQGSLIIHGMEEITVNYKEEIYQILERGAARRQTAATLMNSSSSRSHSVFSVTIHTKDTTITGEELLKTGKLYLVDLAGSENIGRSGAVDKRAREAGNINQSLLTLGRVITALVEHAPHVPYRESKLTRLLQDSLGGKTKTCIIATISPSLSNLEETLSTLDYAHRAKNIQNRPEINQKLTKKALIKEYTNEIETLKKDLLAAREKNGIFVAEDNYNSMVSKLALQDTLVKDMEEKITALIEEKDKIQELFEKTDRQLEDTSETLKSTQNELNETTRNLTSKTNECEEQKFLVTEYMKTEADLFTRAEKLLTTAEDSTSDVHGLHDKLDRKKGVEASNSKQLADFQDKVQASTKAMNQMANDMLGAASKSRNDNIAQLNVLHEVQKTFSGNMLKCWVDVVDGVKNHMQQMKISRETEFEETKAFLKETTTEVTTLKENSVDHLKAINAELVSNMQSQMSSFQLMQTLLVQLKQQLEKQNAEHEQQMRKLSEGLKEQLSAITSLVSDHVSWQEDQTTLMKQNIEESTCCNSDLAKYLHQIIDGAKMALTKHESFTLLDQSMGELVKAQEETKIFGKLQSEIKSSQGSICRWSEEVVDSTKQGVDSAIKTVEKVMCEGEGAQDRCTTVETTFTKHLHKATENWDECLSAVSEKMNNNQTNANTNQNIFFNQTEKLESACVSAKEEATTLTEESSQTITQHVHSLLDCEKSHFDSVTQNVEDWKSGLTSQLNNVDSFIENFAHDMPTGATPKRRQFSYPTELPKTDDPDDLIMRFRENRKDEYVKETNSVECTPVTTRRDCYTPSAVNIDADIADNAIDTSFSSTTTNISKVNIDADIADNASDTSFSSTTTNISRSIECKENRSQMPAPLLSAKKSKRSIKRTDSNSSKSRFPLKMSNH